MPTAQVGFIAVFVGAWSSSQAPPPEGWHRQLPRGPKRAAAGSSLSEVFFTGTWKNRESSGGHHEGP